MNTRTFTTEPKRHTNHPRRVNISTPSVADVNSINSNNIVSSTSTPPAHIAVCAPIRLLSSSGQWCQRCAARQPQAVAHTAKHWRLARTPTCPIPQWNGKRAARSINLKQTDEAVSMRFGRTYTAAGGSKGQGKYSRKGAHPGLLLESLVAVFFSVPEKRS